jgi:hypothetical protein
MSEALNRVRQACERLNLRIEQDRSNSFRVQCPAHNGDDCNLAVRAYSDGWVGFACHSHGCTRDDILVSLGLRLADIGPGDPDDYRGTVGTGITVKSGIVRTQAPTPDDLPTLLTRAVLTSVPWEYPEPEPPHGIPFREGYSHEASFIYRDLRGEPLYAKEKWRSETDQADKDIRHSVWDRISGIWKIGGKPAGTPDVFYNAPELYDAIARKLPVILVEGEKDADRVTSHLRRFAVKAAVVSFPNGAKQNYPLHMYALLASAAHLIIIGDNDEVGKGFVQNVHDTLTGQFGTQAPRMFMPAEGKDVTDHLDSGLGLSRLVPFEVPRGRGTLDTGKAVKPGISGYVTLSASQIPTRKRKWLWEGMIPAGTLVVFAGIGGTGKSSAAVGVLSRLTAGTLPGDFHGSKRKVAVIQVEDDAGQEVIPRFLAAGADLSYVMFPAVMTEDGPEEAFVDLSRDRARLVDWIRSEGIAAIVIDPITAFFGSKSIDNTQDVRTVLHPLVRAVARTDTGLIVVSHQNKDSLGSIRERLSGSTAFDALARSVWGFARDEANSKSVMTELKPSLLNTQENPVLSYEYTFDRVPVVLGDGSTDYPGVFRLGKPADVTADELSVTVAADRQASATSSGNDKVILEFLEEHGATAKGDLRKAMVPDEMPNGSYYNSINRLERKRLIVLNPVVNGAVVKGYVDLARRD